MKPPTDLSDMARFGFLNCLNFDEVIGGQKFGTLEALARPYSEKLTEQNNNLLSPEKMAIAMSNDSIASQNDILTVVFDSGPCDIYTEKMRNFVDEVNGNNSQGVVVDYNLRSRNSNGVAWGLLQSAGIKHPVAGQHRRWTWGYTSEVYRLLTGLKVPPLDEEAAWM